MNWSLDVAGYRLNGWLIISAVAGVLVVTLLIMRMLKTWKASPGVRMATLAAVMCTAVSTNTSWRYFGQHLDVTNTAERTLMFATAEVILFGLALLTREKYKATDGESGGPAGVLVWVISGIACVPAFVEGGVTGGFVRSFLGPIFAAVLWHLAMGIELIHSRPEGAEESEPKGTVARLVKFVREAALATLGLAEPDRDAKEIRMDRAAARAVRLADEYGEMSPDERRKRRGRKVAKQLRAAIRVAEIGSDPVRRDRLMLELAATRNALALATIDFPAPWAVPAVPMRLAAEAAALVRQSDPDAELAAILAAETDTAAAAGGTGYTDTPGAGDGDGAGAGSGYAGSDTPGGDADTRLGYGRVAGRGDADTVGAYAARPWVGNAETGVSGNGTRRAETPSPSTVALVNGSQAVSARVADTRPAASVSVTATVPSARRADADTARRGDASASPSPAGQRSADTSRVNGYGSVATLTETARDAGDAETETGEWPYPWSRETGEAAKKVVRENPKITAREFGPAVRAEKVTFSSAYATELRKWAYAPNPAPDDDPQDGGAAA